MDLFSLMSYETLFLVPFVVYLLFFNKGHNGRSEYTYRDIFYPIKYYFAKNTVKALQEKGNKEKRKKEEEGEQFEFPTKQHTFYQAFDGADQKGNSLNLKFTLRSDKLAEVFLVLRLPNGNIYSFPGESKLHVASIKENQFKINGLLIEKLEPLSKCRVVYNGLLQNLKYKDFEKVEHVQFHFIFNAVSSPKFFPEDVDKGVLTETLATKLWRDGSWKHFLTDQAQGYEQFGALLGFIKGEAFPEETLVNLPCCRSKYYGLDDRYNVKKELRIFLAENYGVLINLVLKSFEEGDSELNYGYVTHLHNVTQAVTGQDIKLQHIGQHKNIPSAFVAHIKTQTREYKCVFHINQDTISHNSSPNVNYEILNVFAECDVNANQGRALLNFSYYENDINPSGCKAVYRDESLIPILYEKKVEVLPDVLVTNIKSEDAKILELTGGKGTSLALLSSVETKEFLVPDGYIITINAFRKQKDTSPRLKKLLAKLDDVFCGRQKGSHQDTCDEVVKAFQQESILPEISEAIISSLRETRVRSKPDSIHMVSWAVRSSAIGEDSEELSAAGQNETILGCITEEQVLRGVSNCWASLYTYQSVQYRWQHGLPVNSDMAVVVQKMVPAESAGVTFTWHPSSSNPSQMVVSSNYGLGESVVSGKSEPDTFILNRTYDGKICLLDQIIGNKACRIHLTASGVEEIIVNENDSPASDSSFELVESEWSITKEQAIRLGKVGLLLEKVFGGPRDIEWAFYKGDLYLLQSRPITTLTAWSDFELTHEFDSATVTENSVTTMANVGEVFPGATTVLSQSTTLKLTDKGVQRHILRGGVEYYALKSITTYHHHAMIDVILSLHKNAHRKIQMSAKILDLAIFGHEVINENINHITLQRLGEKKRWKLAKETLRLWWWSRKSKKIERKAMDFAKHIMIEIEDKDSAKEIYHRIDERLSDFETAPNLHSVMTGSSVFYQIVAMSVLLEKKEEFSSTHYADFALILSSCDDVISAEVPKYLEKIARIIRDEGYNEEFCTIKPEFGVEWLKIKCPEAYRVFEEFLEHHGHRNLGEFELMEDSWGMNPAMVIPMIQANAKHPRTVQKEVLTADEIVARLSTPVSAITKTVLKRIINNIRQTVRDRENTKSLMIYSYNKLRLAYRQLAKAMVNEGLIPSENLMYHLTHHELGQVINKRIPSLINKATKRQRLFPKWNKLKFPEIMYGLPEPEEDVDIAMELTDVKVTGTPVCAGVVTARACVIVSLDDIGQLKTGDVLITYSTDIGWTPYFPMISGVVTELGGLVSHGAVVAREYGIPCIVGVRNATKLFRTGDKVYLSGETGELAKVQD